MSLKKNPNTLIGKAYDKETYHCWHLIEECIKVPTLQDIHVDTALDAVEKYKDLFTPLDTPMNNCIVLLGKSHIGIYYNNGIYHNDTHGVRYEPLRTIKFRYPSFKYYKVKT